METLWQVRSELCFYKLGSWPFISESIYNLY